MRRARRKRSSRESLRHSIVTLDRAGSSGTRYVAGRVIVKFRDGMPTASLRLRFVGGRAVRAMSTVSQTATVSERPSYANFDVVGIDPGEDPEAVAAALRQRPDVEYAQPAYRMRTDFVPNDRSTRNCSGTCRSSISERAWDIQPAAGSTITVAVLDTGVPYHERHGAVHAPASGRKRSPVSGRSGISRSYFGRAALDLGPGPAGSWRPAISSGTTDAPLDLDGHGTHVSGTIGQLTNNSAGMAGVAFNVKIMPVKVIDGMWDDIFGIAEPGDRRHRRPRDPVRGRQRRQHHQHEHRPAPDDRRAPVIEDAMQYAVGKGVFIAIAAGNSFEQGNPKEVVADIASRVQGAVSVAAVDPDKAHALLLHTGQLYRAVGAGRHPIAASARERLRLAADLRLHARRHLSAAAGALHGTALRRARLHRLRRHVDGDAARGRRGGDADAAGHHRPGGHRSGARAVRRPTSATPAATTHSATG